MNQSFSITPFLRFYKGLVENLGLYLQGEFSYSRESSNVSIEEEPELTNTQNQYLVGIRPGLTYFMSKKLASETSIGSLGYSKFDSDGSNSGTLSGSNFTLSLNPSDLIFEIAYYF